MDVREAIYGRWVVRQFTTEPVDEKVQPPQTAKEVNSRQQGRRKAAAVSWYGSLLIVATLLVAAGWELFRWILAIVTLD